MTRDYAVASATKLHLAWAEKLEAAFEAVVIRALKRAFRPITAQLGAVTAAAEPAGTTPPGEAFVSADDLGQLRTLWATQVADELLPLLAATYQTGEQSVALALTGVSATAPEELSVGAQEWLALAEKRMTRIGDTAWLAARTELHAGFQAGESIDQLARRIRGVVASTSAQARTVARTEVIGASNAGAFAEAQARGLETKTWLNTHDGRTRPTHVRAGEQTVALDDRFEVGDALLRFPGDPLGPPGEVINCRCTLLFDEQPLCRCLPRWARTESGPLLTTSDDCGCSQTVHSEETDAVA